MSGGTRKARWIDSVRFNLLHVIPYYLLGIFRHRPTVARLFERVGIDPFHPRFFESLRLKYSSNRIFVRMLTKQALLVFDVEDVKRVLAHSPAVYSTPELKQRGMSHFQPGAVTISSGQAWQERRQFNEIVLESTRRLHSLGAVWLKHVEASIGDSAPRDWPSFAAIFDYQAQQIVFGRRGGPADDALKLLDRLMTEANRVFFLKGSPKQKRLEQLLRDSIDLGPKECLLGACRRAQQGALTVPENQAPHWLFAIAQTLPVNVVRALLLIVAHPESETKILAELRTADLLDPVAIDGLSYLEAAIQEAMRIWPTTAVLGRRMLRQDTFGDEVVPLGTEVLIVNDYLHRDRGISEDADRFVPDRWIDGTKLSAYNHFSNGEQVCAGKYVALFLAKATLAQLMIRWRFSQSSPVIDAENPIPYSNQYFSIRFKAELRERNSPTRDDP